MPAKILTIGPVKGRFKELVSKVSAIQAKHGPFDALFVLGDFFNITTTADSASAGTSNDAEKDLSLNEQQHSLLSGELQLPIKTYFYPGSCPLPSTVRDRISKHNHTSSSTHPSNGAEEGLVEIAHNLYFASRGPSGVFVTHQGLNVAYCSGTWDSSKYTSHPDDSDDAQQESSSYITQSSVQNLLSHPAFVLPSTSSSSISSSMNTTQAPKPGTLAAAKRALAQQESESAAYEAAMKLLTSRPPIDLLLTNYWPSGITLFSSPDQLPSDPTSRTWGCPPIAQLAKASCPRYHFSLAPSTNDPSPPVGITPEVLQIGCFWERQPYLNDLSTHLPSNPASSITNDQQLQNSWSLKRHRQTQTLESITRFISLANFANTQKKRWFVALNLVPALEQQQHQSQQQVVKPTNLTQSPYFTAPHAADGGSDSKRKRDLEAAQMAENEAAGGDGLNFRFQQRNSTQNKKQKQEDSSGGVPPEGYVCRICNTPGHFIRECPSKTGNKPPSTSTAATASTASTVVDSGGSGGVGVSASKTMALPSGLPSKPAFSSARETRQMIPVGPSNCWFCLSNPSIEKHLIVSIGVESYMCFPRGPFIDPRLSNVPGGGHVLIVPLIHTPSLLTLPTQEEANKVRIEMQTFEKDLQKCFQEHGCTSLQSTLARPSTTQMTHFQTQVVPFKQELLPKLREIVHTTLEKFHGDANNRYSNGKTADDHTKVKLITDVKTIEAFLSGQTSENTNTGAAHADFERDTDYFHVKLGSGSSHEDQPQPASSEMPEEWLLLLPATQPLAPHMLRSAINNNIFPNDDTNTPKPLNLGNWKHCVQPKDQEIESVRGFRDTFKKFNSLG